MFCIFLFHFVYYLFLLLCTFRSRYSVSLYCSVYCWCVNVYCTIFIIVQRDATQSSLFIILQVHSTCFGCQLHPSSGVYKTVTTASGVGQRDQASLATLEGGSCTKIMTSIGGCSYNLCTPDDGCG